MIFENKWSKLIQKKIEEKLQKQCRICADTDCALEDSWVSPCSCKGSMMWVHSNCLKEWIQTSLDLTCSTCKSEYKIHYEKIKKNRIESILFHPYFIISMKIIYFFIYYYLNFVISKWFLKGRKMGFFYPLYFTRIFIIVHIISYSFFYYIIQWFYKPKSLELNNPIQFFADDSLLLELPIDILKLWTIVFGQDISLQHIQFY